MMKVAICRCGHREPIHHRDRTGQRVTAYDGDLKRGCALETCSCSGYLQEANISMETVEGHWTTLPEVHEPAVLEPDVSSWTTPPEDVEPPEEEPEPRGQGVGW